ncbi:MAG: recombination protein RecO [Campylobacterota bacterium]|nr:recombination protein RecO [Campylobacterota bacterium]
MKGFVIALRKAKNEDVIVTILSPNNVTVYYRFFGARHSILQLGHLIDFEVEGEQSSFMPRLRNLSHLGFEWLYNNNRLLLWHNYIKLFEPHLRDTEDISPFYFNLLLEAAKRWDRQNPKRIICESYIALLVHEGRLHDEEICYICEDRIDKNVSLMQAFIPAHPHCIHSSAIQKEKLYFFFESGRTLYLNDNEVEYLYQVAIRGF